MPTSPKTFTMADILLLIEASEERNNIKLAELKLEMTQQFHEIMIASTIKSGTIATIGATSGASTGSMIGMSFGVEASSIGAAIGAAVGGGIGTIFALATNKNAKKDLLFRLSVSDVTTPRKKEADSENNFGSSGAILDDVD